MNLIPFEKKHLSALLPKLKDSAKAVICHENFESSISALVGQGLAQTLVDNAGAPVAVFGGVQVSPGVLEVFILPSKEQENLAFGFAKAARKSVVDCLKSYRRVQALSMDDDFHSRWLSWLGFTLEGRLHAYGMNGEDLLMWGMWNKKKGRCHG